MIHKLLNKKIMAAVVAVAFAFGLSSCTVEEEIDTSGQFADGKVQLELHTNAGSYRIPVTRTGKAGNDGDGSVPGTASKPIVLVFELPEGESDFRTKAVFKEAAQANSNNEVRLTTTTKSVRLLIVSDPPSEITVSGLKTTLKDKTFAGAVTGFLNTAKLSADENGYVNKVPYAEESEYIPATGIYDLVGGIDASTEIGTSEAKVKLERIAAKITVENAASEFVLQGATVLNTTQYGYLYRDILPGPPSTPSALPTDKVHYLTGTGSTGVTDIAGAESGSTADNPLYVYESNAGDITVLMQGEYSGTSYWYRLALKTTEGAPMTVDRNTHYTVTITEVGMRGYASIDDALTGTDVTGSVKYTVLSSGLSDHEIVDNGIYYLGLSNSEFIHWSSDTNNTEVLTTIRTNAPEDTPISIEPIAGYYDDITLSTLTDEAPGNETDIEVKAKFKKDFIVDGRMALYNIKVGALEKQLLVVQRGTSLFIPETPTEFEGKFVAASVEEGKEWLSLAMRDGGSYGDYTTNAVNSSEVGDAIRIFSNVLQMSDGTHLTVDYGTIMTSRTPKEGYTVTVLGPDATKNGTFINTGGGRVKISIAQQRIIVHRFAKSNVVLYIDSDNNQILTFAENEEDYTTKTVKYLGGTRSITFTGTTALKANVQGVHFRWGGLVGISTDTPEGSGRDYYGNAYITFLDYDKDIVFKPVEYTGSLPTRWAEIPYLDPTPLTPKGDDVDKMTYDAFYDKYGPKGYDAEAGKGDICRYISDKGWVEGDWRMPTGREFSNLGKETKEFSPGIRYEIDFDDIEINDRVDLWGGRKIWNADLDLNPNYSGKKDFGTYTQKGVLFGDVTQYNFWPNKRDGFSLYRFDWYPPHRITNNPIQVNSRRYYGFTRMSHARLIGAGVTADDNANRNNPSYEGLTDPVGARIVVPASGNNDGDGNNNGYLYYPGGNGYFMSASSYALGSSAVRCLHVNAVRRLDSSDNPITYAPGVSVSSNGNSATVFSFSVRCIRKLPDEL